MDGQLVYATLFCGAGYIFSEIESHASTVLEQLIPHTYVRGSDHGKSEERGMVWDFKIDANGREAEYEELRNRSFSREVVAEIRTIC